MFCLFWTSQDHQGKVLECFYTGSQFYQWLKASFGIMEREQNTTFSIGRDLSSAGFCMDLVSLFSCENGFTPKSLLL
jgi:hypothetical protein